MEATAPFCQPESQGVDHADRCGDLLRDSLIWDMTLPGMFSGLNEIGALHRYRAAGIGFVSITVGNDSVWNPRIILERLATIGAAIAAQSNSFRIVRSSFDVLQARSD